MNWQTFPRCLTILLFHKQWISVPIFLTCFSILVIVFLFGFSQPSGCELVPYCGFNLHFSNDVEYHFICLLVIHVYYLKKHLTKSFALFKIGLYVFLLLSFTCSLYILDIRYMVLKYFNPFCGLSFYFLDSVFWSTSVFVSFCFV